MIKKIMLKYANPDCNSVSVKKNAFYLIFLVKEVKRVLPADLFIDLNWQFSQKF
jgi:hypothetical protein